MRTVRPAGHSLNVGPACRVFRVSGLASLKRGNSSLNAVGGRDRDRAGSDMALFVDVGDLDYPGASDNLWLIWLF